MEDVSNTLQQMQEKEDNITEDLINLKKVARWQLLRLDNCGHGMEKGISLP